ncbi:hypothetical protein B0H14DRAFT_2646764 [Mycena olivaceomarginata]|nr:hypothetical protein B0H14DRAFT_2646764 [Mycena olivaceomarginata]
MKSPRQFERDWLSAGTRSMPHHQQWRLGQAEPAPVNNDSNMLSINQPVGVGFSHGGKSAQRFTLSKTESYEGHYDPPIAAYSLSQYMGIAVGKVGKQHLNLKTLIRTVGTGVTLTRPSAVGLEGVSATRFKPLMVTVTGGTHAKVM